MSAWVMPALLGFGAGILSAWGIGGGTLLLLCMTLFLGVDAPTARMINLLYFLPTAGMSLPQHRKGGYLDAQALRQVVPPGVACALLGVWAAAKIDTALLRRAFGVFLLWAGVSVLREGKDYPSAR